MEEVEIMAINPFTRNVNTGIKLAPLSKLDSINPIGTLNNKIDLASRMTSQKPPQGNQHAKWWQDILGVVGMPITAVEGVIGATGQAIAGKNWGKTFVGDIKSQFTNNPFGGFQMWEQVTNDKSSMDKMNPVLKSILGIGTDIVVGFSELGVGEISGLSNITRTASKFAGDVVSNLTAKLFEVNATNAGVRGAVARGLMKASDDLKVKFSPFYKMSNETKSTIESTTQAVNMNKHIIETADKQQLAAKTNYVNQIMDGTETPELKEALNSKFHQANPMISKELIEKARKGTLTDSETKALKSQSNNFMDAYASHAFQVRNNRNISVLDLKSKMEEDTSDPVTKTKRLRTPVAYDGSEKAFNKDMQETLSKVMGKSFDKKFIVEAEKGKHQIQFRQSMKTDNLPTNEEGDIENYYHTENSIVRFDKLNNQYEHIKNTLSNPKTEESVNANSSNPDRKIGMTGTAASGISTKVNSFLEKSGLTKEDGEKYHYNNTPGYRRNFGLRDAKKSNTIMKNSAKSIAVDPSTLTHKEIYEAVNNFKETFKFSNLDIYTTMNEKKILFNRKRSSIEKNAIDEKEHIAQDMLIDTVTPKDDETITKNILKSGTTKKIDNVGSLRVKNGKLYFNSMEDGYKVDSGKEWNKLSPKTQDAITKKLPKSYGLDKTSQNISKEKRILMNEKIAVEQKKVDARAKSDIAALTSNHIAELNTIANKEVVPMEKFLEKRGIKTPSKNLTPITKFDKLSEYIDGNNKKFNEFSAAFNNMEIYNSAKWFVNSMEKNHVLPTGGFGDIRTSENKMAKDLIDPLDIKTNSMNNLLFSLTHKGEPFDTKAMYDASYLPNMYSDQFKQQELDAGRYISNTDNLANSMLHTSKSRLGTAVEVSDAFGMKVIDAEHQTVNFGMDTNVIKQTNQICNIKAENYSLSSIMTSALDNEEIRIMNINEIKKYTSLTNSGKQMKNLPRGYSLLNANEFKEYMERAQANKFLTDEEKEKLGDISTHINTMFEKSVNSLDVSDEEKAERLAKTTLITRKSNLIINSQLKEMLDMMINPPKLGDLKSSILKVNSLWKKFTVLHPSYYTHILGGNFMNAISAGKNPIQWTRFFTRNAKRMKIVDKLWEEKIPDILKDNLEVALSPSAFRNLVSSKLEGAEKEAWDFWHTAYDNGLTHLNTGRVNATTSSYTEALSQNISGATSTGREMLNKISQWGMKMTNYIDDSSRAAVYEMTLNNPKSSRFFRDKIGIWDNNKIAAEEAKMVHFDYSRMTPFESSSAFRMLIPFYAWWKQNLNLQFNLLLSPLSAKVKQDLGSWQNDYGSLNANGINKFDYQSGYLPIWKTNNNVALLKITPPSNDLQYLISPTTLGRVSPFVQTAYNTFTGKSLSTGYTETRRANLTNLATPGMFGALNRVVGQSIIDRYAGQPKKYTKMKANAAKWGVYLSPNKKTLAENIFSGMVKIDNYKSNMTKFLDSQLAWYEKELSREGKPSVGYLEELANKSPTKYRTTSKLSKTNKLLR